MTLPRVTWIPERGVFFVAIPGQPVAQGRPRAFRRGAGLAIVDPTKSRNWKAYAAGVYQQALAAAGFGPSSALLVPVGKWAEVNIEAVFACPPSQHRKREPRQRRPHTGRPDADNLLKSVLDAGNGVLWVDDAQVAFARVRKIVGAQWEAPRVEVTIQVHTEGTTP